MISRVLVLAALASCALVLGSFAMFASDQLGSASEHQQTEVASGAQASTQPAPSTHKTAQPRRFIEGAAKALTSPFESFAQSGSQWARRGVPTAIALLVYGLGLGFLARFSRGLA